MLLRLDRNDQVKGRSSKQDLKLVRNRCLTGSKSLVLILHVLDAIVPIILSGSLTKKLVIDSDSKSVSQSALTCLSFLRPGDDSIVPINRRTSSSRNARSLTSAANAPLHPLDSIMNQ